MPAIHPSIPTSILPEHLKAFQYLTEKQVFALTGRAVQSLRLIFDSKMPFSSFDEA